MLKVAVSGAGGRMGRRIIALAIEAKEFEVVAALEQKGYPQLGEDAGTVAQIGEIGVTITDEPGAGTKPEVLIDFSTPAGTEKWLKYAAANKVALVTGTTGLSGQQEELLQAAAKKTAVLRAANMSLGVNLLFKLAAEAAAILNEDYDIEVVETHHRFKQDAPSGTALELARRMAKVKGWDWPNCLVHGREGRGAQRQGKTIGMHAVRAGDTVGEHRVIFAALGETVELRHDMHSRDTLAQGALTAAKWLAEQKPGLYSMFDVLGLK